MSRNIIKLKDLLEGVNNTKAGQAQVIEKLAPDFRDGKLDIHSFSMSEAFYAFCDPEGNLDKSSPIDQIAEAMQGSAFPRFLYQVITPIIVKEYDTELGNALALVTQEDTDTDEVLVPGLGNFYGPSKVSAGTDYPQDDASHFDCKIKMHKYGHIISLTREAILADKPGLISSRAAGAGRYMGRLIHEIIVKKIANITTLTLNGEATNTAFVYNGTGYAHLSNDHSSVDGQTNDNLSATAFSDAGVAELWTLLRKLKDNRGKPNPVTPRWLMVPEALWKDATQLVSSEKEIGSANNEINVWKAKFNVFSSPFFDDNSAVYYYLGDPAVQTYLFWRMRPTTIVKNNLEDDAFKRDIVSQFRHATEFNVGMLDYRYIGQGGA